MFRGVDLLLTNDLSAPVPSNYTAVVFSIRGVTVVRYCMYSSLREIGKVNQRANPTA